MTNIAPSKPDYGFDGSPLSVVVVCLAGMALFAGGLALFHFPSFFLNVAAFVLLLLGFLLVLVSGFYLYYVNRGKLQRRDAMLSLVEWTGNETVLDVGTGRGLLMIGAAKKLTSGKSIGIDIWDLRDMHGNSVQKTLRNAEIEGVREKVEVLSEDVRELSFPEETFDVVLSNLCLHNIPTADGRDKACREIARVLKPGGTAIIADKSFIKAYGATFASTGLTVECFRPSFDGSLRGLVKAVKP